VTPSQISFDIHDKRITDLENRLSEGTLENSTPHGDYEEIVDRVYRVGEWNKMYGQPANQNIPITETIGKIDGKDSVTDAINNLTNSDKDRYTISEAIQTLVQKLQEKESAIVTAQTAIKGLEARLSDLEKTV
jgi:hypothetical protein